MVRQDIERTNGREAGLEAWKWLEGKGPQRQLRFGDGDEVMEGV